MHCARVSVLIVLLVGLVQVHCFSWDVVLGNDRQLEFYNNGTLTHTEDVVPSSRIVESVTYDPVHYRLLFTDSDGSAKSISSFDLSTRKTQRLLTTTADYSTRVAYDPVTQALFWKDGYSIRSFSLNPASSNKADGNLLFKLEHYCSDLAVDSCGGFIYWVTDYEIERARLDGSEREVLIDGDVFHRTSLAIDQQTQRMYWTETIWINDGYQVYIESANFNGKDRTTLYVAGSVLHAFSLAVSKDFIYWQSYNDQGIWQLPKYSSQPEARKLYSVSSSDNVYLHRIATNYTLEEQIEGVKSCHALQALIPHDSNSGSTVPVCQNYCFQGECGVSADGRPTCSCKAGYSGERCEVYACHKHCSNGGVCSLNEENKPVCQCTAGYVGERCDVSICKDYCLHQGNCSVGAESLPNCSCKAGYSGERCEVYACHQYCSNGGVCSLNEENKPVCQCTAGYVGERCDVSICKDYCLHQGNCSVGAESLPNCSCAAGYSGERCEVAGCRDYCLRGNCSVGAEGGLTCSCETGYSGARCEVNACQGYCLNGGVCSLNEEDEPACECAAGYDGGRCELPAYNDNSMDACGAGGGDACRQFCLNGGACSLGEAGAPVCRCAEHYAGERCDLPAFLANWVLHSYKNVPPATLSAALRAA
ncbi:hypothetical protein PYW07_011933 [Mythimna separata]|uniref:EGF-like domain-containing protein n=1 Tax=Mythimna separata TaxID=271217 RepID=A0AAD7Y762_MYTSE|nr:hypothetical protein PYW07_011933 [Mythimna separata]